MVEREGWSTNATFSDCEYKTVKDVVTRLQVAVAKGTKLILTSSNGEGCFIGNNNKVEK